MSTNDSIILQTMQDMQMKFQQAGLAKNVLLVYDENDLFDKIKNVTMPVIGITYVGTVPVPEDPGQQSHKVGVSTRSNFFIVYLTRKDPMTQLDMLPVNLNALSQIRQVLRNTRGPSQHFYRFDSEIAAVLKSGVMVWIQRWSVPIQLAING